MENNSYNLNIKTLSSLFYKLSKGWTYSKDDKEKGNEHMKIHFIPQVMRKMRILRREIIYHKCNCLTMSWAVMIPIDKPKHTREGQQGVNVTQRGIDSKMMVVVESEMSSPGEAQQLIIQYQIMSHETCTQETSYRPSRLYKHPQVEVCV